MKAAVLRPLYPAVGAFTTVYADTSRDLQDATDPAELALMRWEEMRADLLQAGSRPPTLEAIGLVLTDPDLTAPGHAIFARDGEIVGTVALSAAPAAEVARVSPLPHLRHLLAGAPLLNQVTERPLELAPMTDVEGASALHALAAVTDADALRKADDQLSRRIEEWHELRWTDQAALGVKETLAALRDGLAAVVFLRCDPALAEPAWLGPAGTDLAISKEELAEAGLLAPLCDRTDEAIIRAAATTDAELFVLSNGRDLSKEITEGVAATLRYPMAMS